MPIALAVLGGCATSGAVKYQIAPSTGGDKYDLACVQSSSGSCRVRIESAQAGASYADVAAGTTQTLEHAETGASFCVSDTTPGWLMCKMQQMHFAPAGALVTALHR